MREACPQFTGILTMLPDGRLFCDSLRSGRVLDLRDRAYFKAALASKGAVALQPTFGRLTGQAVLQVAYPRTSSRRCAPISAGSDCSPPCAAAPMTGRR